MPRYVFVCPKCGHHWDIICKISEYAHTPKTCPKCKKAKGEQTAVCTRCGGSGFELRRIAEGKIDGCIR